MVSTALSGNIGGYDQYGKRNYGKAAYSWSAIQPTLSASLSVWNNLVGNFTPAVSFHGNLNVVATGSLIGDFAPQAALGGLLTVVQPFGGNLSPEIVFGASAFVSRPLWAEGAPCPPPMWTPELCPGPGWIPLTAPGNLVYQGSAYGLGGYGANRYGLGTYVPAGLSPWSPAELCNG